MNALEFLLSQQNELLENIDRNISNATDSKHFAALALIKIENISTINEAFGFDAGSEYLQKISKELKLIVPDFGGIYSLSTDVFGLVVPNLDNAEIALLLAERVKRAFQNGIEINNQKINGRPIIGIGLNSLEQPSAKNIYLLAEKALTEAKRKLNRVAILPTQDTTQILPFYDLESQLEVAVERSDLQLYFQPKLSLHTGEIESFEALLRWKHKNTFIPPQIFIPCAEESEVILDVTKWVIHYALRVISEQHSSAENWNVAINISKSCFENNWLEQTLKSALSIWGVSGERLILEITETAFTDNLELIQETCATIRETTGCRISIDDYGTGYSSFEFFKDVHSDELKIDRSFITNLHQLPRLQSIVRCMTELANSAKMKTVVEGVETIDELQKTIELGAGYAQGYFIAPPMPEQDVANWLDENRKTLKELIQNLNN